AERTIIRTRGYLFGMIIVLIGTAGAVLLGDDPVDFSHAAGVALAITSGMLFALYGLAVRKYMRGINSVLAFSSISQYTALVMVLLMLFLGDRAGATVVDLTGEQLFWLLVSAVVGIALGHVF